MTAAQKQLVLFAPGVTPEAVEIQRAVALIRREDLSVAERLDVLAVVCRVELGRAER